MVNDQPWKEGVSYARARVEEPTDLGKPSRPPALPGLKHSRIGVTRETQRRQGVSG
jgi:hypothetical protein